MVPVPFPIRNGSHQVQGSRQENQWNSHRGIQVREDVWDQYQAKVRPISYFIRIQLLISPYWFFLDDHLIPDFWFLISHANIATNCSQATVISIFTHGKGLPGEWELMNDYNTTESELLRVRGRARLNLYKCCVPTVNMRANVLFLLDLHAGQHNTNLRTQTHSCLVIHWKVNAHSCMMFTSRSYLLSTFAWSLLLALRVWIPIAFVPGGLGGSHGETQGIGVVGFAGVLILALGEQAPQRVHSNWKEVIALRQVLGCAVLECKHIRQEKRRPKQSSSTLHPGKSPHTWPFARLQRG